MGSALSSQGNSVTSSRQVLGDTSGTAVPAGSIGQVVELTQSTPTSVPGATTQYGNILTISSANVPQGNWLLSGVVHVYPNGATGTIQYASVSDYSGNTTTDHVLPTQTQFEATQSNLANGGSFVFANCVVNVTNSSNKYIKIRVDYSGATPQYRYGFRLVRI